MTAIRKVTEVQWIVINNLHEVWYKMDLPQKLAVHGVLYIRMLKFVVENTPQTAGIPHHL